MTTPTAIVNLCSNAWRWDLLDFAEKLWKDSDEKHVRDQFLAFQEAARALGRLSPEVLRLVCAEDTTPEPTADSLHPQGL